MDWAAVGAIAELLGALGVILSLLYLATQVRDNTRSVRASMYQSMVNSSGNFTLTIGADPQVALTLQKGLDGVEELSEEEEAQFRWLFHNALRQEENAHFQYSNGTLDPELWEGWQDSTRGVLGSPGGRRMWPAVRGRLRSSFVEYVEREVMARSTEGQGAAWLSARPSPPTDDVASV